MSSSILEHSATRKSTNSFNRILLHSTQVVLKCFFYDRAFPFSARKRKKSYYHSTKFSIEVYLFLVWFLLNAEEGGERPCSLHPTMFFFAAQLDKLGPALAEKAAASQTDDAILSNKQNGFIQRSHLCSQTSAYVLDQKTSRRNRINSVWKSSNVPMNCSIISVWQ